MHSVDTQHRHLAIFVAFSGSGGVEKVIYNLLMGLSSHDVQVDLLVVVGKRGWLPEIPWPNVRVIKLKTKHSQLALFELVQYLRAEKPAVMMVAKDRAVRTAILAHKIAGVKTKLVGQLHMNVGGFLKSRPFWQRWLRTAPMRWLFPSLDMIIGVSQGVVEDTIEITGIAREKTLALPNPIIIPKIHTKADELTGLPWLDEETGIPVLLGAGRLSPEKDFSTLLQAFRLVLDERPCRLAIIGDGPLKEALEQQIEQLGLKDAVILAGYSNNPYSYMKKASLLVFSSIAEGSGNVLIEAMALGTPVVSTDCPYGPAETLAHGKYGALVPVGDALALARAILNTLDNPLPASILQEAVAEFTVARSTELYLQALGFEP